MAIAHLYVFSDACPSDWLTEGHDDDWHTIVNLVFQSDPALQALVEQGESHETVLARDAKYTSLISDLQEHLPSGRLRKWGTGPGYRARFCTAFSTIHPNHRPMVSACSFQEKTLRGSKSALLHSYNRLLGGIEGRGIGFEEYTDDKGRHQMKHEFLNADGYHKVRAPVDQMLVLLFMSWFVADQFVFYSKEIVRSGRFGFDGLAITIVSDKLSGDDDLRRASETNLRNLIDPENERAPIVVTRSPVSDTFSGDLLVDNLAGWLTSAITSPTGEHAEFARNLAPSGVSRGWHELLPSSTKLTEGPALSRLEGRPASDWEGF